MVSFPSWKTGLYTEIPPVLGIMVVRRQVRPRACWNIFKSICSYQEAGDLQPGCGSLGSPWVRPVWYFSTPRCYPWKSPLANLVWPSELSIPPCSLLFWNDHCRELFANHNHEWGHLDPGHTSNPSWGQGLTFKSFCLGVLSNRNLPFPRVLRSKAGEVSWVFWNGKWNTTPFWSGSCS